MGYYTRYSLECQSDELMSDETAYAIEAFLDEIGVIHYALARSYSSGFFDAYEEAKWYDHEECMRVVSTQFPRILFVLRGDGESNDDMWVKYFLNGKMQAEYAKITFGDFDENKLS